MLDVLTIGSATEDVFLSVSKSRIIHSRRLLSRLRFTKSDSAQCLPIGAKLEVDQLVRQSGGGATNAAVTFARQGFSVTSVFKIGDDIFGREIITELKREKVDIRPVIGKNLATGYSTVLVAGTGDRTILVHRGAETTLALKDIPPLQPSWAYLNPSRISFSVISSLIKRLRAAGTLIAINPSQSFLELGFSKLMPLLKAAAVIILNREEASFLTGQPYHNERAIFKKFDELVPGLAVMTEGPGGVLVSDGRSLWRAGIFSSLKPIDRTGAGDAFGSGFVAGLLRTGEPCSPRGCLDDNIKYSLRLGSANAASVVASFGAKTGILTKHDFTAARWRHLPISLTSL